jgi:YVTN family beta-propeller protein
MVSFRLLGPVEAQGEAGPIALGSGKQRALLAVLLLHANRPVTRETLIDALWGERPPASAHHALDVYVSRLRKALGDGDLLATRPGGYVLRADAGQIDVLRFEELVAAAREAPPAEAARLLREALALWQGPALADLRDEPGARIEGERLEELRLDAQEELHDAELALGRHAALVPELQAHVARHPLRERPRRQLMLALYRSGRQADALAAYHDARSTLVEELGVDPSPELRALERAILDQDPALAPPPAPREPEPHALPPRRRRRRGALAAAALAAVVGGVVAVLVAHRGQTGLAGLAPESAGYVDAHGHLTLDVLAGSRPSAVAFGFGSAWVANEGAGTVSRIDPRTEAVVQTVRTGADPRAVAVAGGSVWVANGGEGTLTRIDPRTDATVQTIRIGNGPAAVASDGGLLWVANDRDGTLVAVDDRTGRIRRTIPIGGNPAGLAVAGGALWVSDDWGGQVLRIDPVTTAATAVSVGNAPTTVAADARGVWVANSADGTVSQIDPASGSVVRTVPLGTSGPLATAGGSVWAGEPARNALVPIDSASGRIRRTIALGSSPGAVVAGGRGVWVTTLAPLAAHRGGTLVIDGFGPFGVVDPAFLLDGNDAVPTNDGLVAYSARPGLANGTVVADLATSVPRPSDGGRTYTFKLRRGIRYSDGSLVRPSDVRFSIERLYKLRPKPSPYVLPNELTGIGFLRLHLVGEAACLASRRMCDLSRGIVADDAAGTVTFHLVRPDPDFLAKLAYPEFDLLPPSAPLRTDGTRPVPATGPYVVRVARPSLRVLVRNPRFAQWSADAQPDGFPDRIVLRAVAPNRALRDVLAGRADAALSPDLTPAEADQLQTSDAAALHLDPYPLDGFLFLNTRVAPFDRLAARRAVADAIDRTVTTRFLRSWTSGFAKPTCQILTPDWSGYVPYCPYTLHPSASGAWDGPDVLAAERNAAASGTRGTRVVLYMPGDRPFGRSLGRYLARLFESLGWPTTVRFLPINASGAHEYFAYVGDSANRVQAGWGSWESDFSTAASFLDDLLGCDAFAPDSTNNANVAEFCDPSVERLIDRAKALEATNRGAATALWTQVDHRLVDLAPVVPLAVPESLTVTSRRLGNYQPLINALTAYDQWWVR